MRPLIGVTGRRYPATRVSGISRAMRETSTDIHFSTYTAKIDEAGGLPVQLSMDADPAALAARLDGLVLSGGADVDPARYAGRTGARVGTIEAARDAFELALVTAALELDTPVLGICRGAQVLNVARGGTLVPDLAEHGESHPSGEWPGSKRRHRVTLTCDSVLFALYGPEVWVNSLHHQAVDRPGTDVTVVGRADDGVVEAIEFGGAAAIGVQWHPELLDGLEPVFTWIVERARARSVNT